MAFHDIDLSSRPGAEWATHLGSIGSFGFAAITVFSLVISSGMAGFRTDEGMFIAIGGGVQLLIAGIAGMRFREGKGAFIGIAAAALLGLSLLGQVLAVSILGIIINGVLLVCIVQGLRGAWALRKDLFPGDEVDVFE